MKRMLIVVLIFASTAVVTYLKKSDTNKEPIREAPRQKEAVPPKITEKRPSYKDYNGIVDMMRSWEKEAPDFVEVLSYGKTTKGIEQYYAKITNKKKSGNKPSCVITGCIHGNEPISTCTETWWMTELLSSYSSDPEAKEILDSREIYFIPVLSPDTFPHSRHVDGVDPNRNFPSSGEKQSVTPIENFKNLFKEKKFNAFMSGHSYGRVFLLARDSDPERRDAYEKIKDKMDSISSYRASYLGGPGTTLDADWGNRRGAISLIVEFGTHQVIPSDEDIKTEFDATYKSFLYFAKEAPVAFASKCGYAEFRNEFELEAEFDSVVNYIENNKRKLTEEMNIRLVEDMGGGKVKLSRKTRRGEFTWVADEEISRSDKQLTYRCQLDKSHDSEDIKEMDVEVSIREEGRSCKVSVKMSLEVEGVSQKELKVDCNGRYRRVKMMLEDALESDYGAKGIDTPIRVLILKHSKEKMADDDAKMVVDAIGKASGLDVKSVGNHFINDTKKIRVCLGNWEEIENLKEFMSEQMRTNKTSDSTLIVFTIGHGSPSGGLHNLGKRSELQMAIAEAAEENDQKVLWWQLSCYAAAKLPPIESLNEKQMDLLSVLNTSDEKTPSPAYIEGKIMEQMFASISSGEMDADGNQEINGLEFSEKMNKIRKGRGNLLRMRDPQAPLFGISPANRIPIFDTNNGRTFPSKGFIPFPRRKN